MHVTINCLHMLGFEGPYIKSTWRAVGLARNEAEVALPTVSPTALQVGRGARKPVGLRRLLLMLLIAAAAAAIMACPAEPESMCCRWNPAAGLAQPQLPEILPQSCTPTPKGPHTAKNKICTAFAVVM